MDDNIQLEELQHDAIIELLNIGMGKAAASLSLMLNEEVKLSIPRLELLTRQQAANHLNTQPQQGIVAIKQYFHGPFWGEALLLFQLDNNLEFLRLLIKDNLPSDLLIELEADALMEVGNIILSAGLFSLANNLNEELTSDLPLFVTGTAVEILEINASQKNEVIMLLRMDFALENKDISLYAVFILDLPSIKQFKSSIDQFLGKLRQ
ncbi:MAG: chemotaxis protein CheC [Candidatus Parabeggiatoa sp. nov. 3]|nr:MAG: chemotaxis protein CheC [Gammaproteobacteria bacterium]RKZ65562.1 MAG: chemotaxis protein CheC [Gammaproteobacteria bacterium]RKZ78288.1 MAG: chemotaxis protein CheC [Gammaproteobacteria bacterium]